MYIPSVGAKGKFKFGTPYDKLTNAEQVYTVVSVDSIPNLVNSGKDPLVNIYRLVGRTDNDYNNDLNNKIVIITFSTGGKETFSIPANKILSTPILDGHIYRQTQLVVPLGLMPIIEDYKPILKDLKNLMWDRLGVNSVPVVMYTSAESMLTEQKNIEVANMRNSRILSKETDNQKLKALQIEYAKLADEYSVLVKYVEDNIPQ